MIRSVLKLRNTAANPETTDTNDTDNSQKVTIHYPMTYEFCVVGSTGFTGVCLEDHPTGQEFSLLKTFGSVHLLQIEDQPFFRH